MNAIQHIIETVFSVLVRQPEAYTTVVYPTRGKAVVLHDGLGISAERSWYEMSAVLQEESNTCSPKGSPLNPFDGDSDLSSMTNDVSPIMEPSGLWHAGSDIAVNPATGLPMLDGCTDVMGSPLGFDLQCFDDFSGGISCSGFDAIDSCSDMSDFSL
ncbi:MAG: hypothetical protein ACOH2I_05585 [Pseudomonas sp.]